MKIMNYRVPALFVLVFSVLFACGVGVFGWGIYSWGKFHQMEKWPTVRANIETCRFVEGRGSDGPWYHVEILYSYVVNGKSYTGDRIAFDYSGGSKEEEVRAVYEKLFNANKVQAAYNPLRHEESLLAPGYTRSFIFTLIFGSTFLAFVTGMGVTVLMSVSSERDKSILLGITVLESKIDDGNLGMRKGE